MSGAGGALRVLCLSNMWPGPHDPDFGSFVADMCAALERRGLLVERAVIDTRAHGLARTPLKYAGLTARALRLARRADVIYAHYLFPTGAVAAAAGRASGRPWVVTAHGRDVRNLARGLVRSATAAGLSGASAVIAVSRRLAADLRASGLDLPPVYVAHMGVDLDRFRPADRAAARRRLHLEVEGPLVLAVGGLTERKNPLGLLQAFARVRAARPDARLAFVGSGPLAGAVDAGTARLGLSGAVIRAGAMSHDHVPEWIAACDVLAMPSLVEPLGIVALEALASGRPVVATTEGGAREVVPEGLGALVDPHEPGAIAAALGRLLDAPPSPARCRAFAEGQGVDRQAARVAQVLREAATVPR